MNRMQKMNQFLQFIIYLLVIIFVIGIGISFLGSYIFSSKSVNSLNTIELKPDANKTEDVYVNFVSKPTETNDENFLVSYIVKYLSSEKSRSSLKSYSYSSNKPYTHFIGRQYWGCFNCTISNLRIYNRKSSNYFDLFDKNVLINGFMIPKNKDEKGNLVKEQLKYLFYSKVEEDYNQDKKLDKEDGYRLFMVEMNGKNKIALSPKGTDFVDIKIDHKYKKFYIQVKEDSNKDGKFDKKDNTSIVVKKF